MFQKFAERDVIGGAVVFDVRIFLAGAFRFRLPARSRLAGILTITGFGCLRLAITSSLIVLLPVLAGRLLLRHRLSIIAGLLRLAIGRFVLVLGGSHFLVLPLAVLCQLLFGLFLLDGFGDGDFEFRCIAAVEFRLAVVSCLDVEGDDIAGRQAERCQIPVVADVGFRARSFPEHCSLRKLLPLPFEPQRQFAKAEIGVAGGDQQRNDRIGRAFQIALGIEEHDLRRQVGPNGNRVDGGIRVSLAVPVATFDPIKRR